MMNKLQLELLQREPTKELKVREHHTRHDVMVQTDIEDKFDEVIN